MLVSLRLIVQELGGGGGSSSSGKCYYCPAVGIWSRITGNQRLKGQILHTNSPGGREGGVSATLG